MNTPSNTKILIHKSIGKDEQANTKTTDKATTPISSVYA